MRAAVFHGPGDVRVEDVDAPGEPGTGELLLAVTRAAICGTDAGEFAHGPKLVPLEQRHPQSGHVGPTVLGHEFTGRVVAVGDGVDGFSEGDRVVSGAGVSCGDCAWCRAGRTNLCAAYYTLGLHTHGGLAETVRVPASTCVRVPDACDDTAAALAQPLAVGLHVLNRGRVRTDDSLAVIGVGGIGAMVVAGAASRGIRKLIAVDVDDDRLSTARAIGAATTVDARSEDVAAAICGATSGEGADLVVECTGRSESPRIAIEAAKRGGKLVIVGLQAQPVELDLHRLVMQEIEMTTAMAHVCGSDIPEAIEILADTRVAEQVVDSVVPIERVVDEGLRRLVEGTAKGKIVIDTSAAR
jgi:(R,R)-butanediol dehydrogenase/meso-butanediol dehydrogenase/diacetyl reductase